MAWLVHSPAKSIGTGLSTGPDEPVILKEPLVPDFIIDHR